MTTIPAVVYAAKSTVDTHNSIGGNVQETGERGQLEDCRDLADASGWERRIEWEFRDEDKSAYHGNRGDGLTRAMACCERLRAEYESCKLVVQHSSRLARGDGRRAEHLLHYALWALRSRIDIVSVEDPGTFEGMDGEYGLLKTYIGGEQNTKDSKRKADSVKKGHARRAQRGQPNGGPAGYGFRWRDVIGADEVARKRRVIDQPEAAVVRRIFAEFIAGRSQCQITRDLNADGIPTADAGKVERKDGKPRERPPSGRWYQGSVAKLLRCALYVGKFTHNGEILDTDEVPPIIDLDTWNKAQALLARSSEDTGRVDARGRKITRGRGRGAAGRHLFRKGMLRCSCGSAMTPFTRPNRTPGLRRMRLTSVLAARTGSQPALREPYFAS